MDVVDDHIILIDTYYQRPGHSASYLVHDSGEAAFIETGTSHAVPLLLAALEQHHIARDQVKYVIVTHIHLDHAGGAGALLRHLPNAQLVVHPRGVRHMVQPQRLIDSSRQVYGDRFDRLYGTIHPVAEDRVIVATEDTEIILGSRSLRFLDVQGHARHHCCVWDERHRVLFSGDAFGISFREFDVADQILIFPATTPTQFDPDAACQAIERIVQWQPRCVCLTHFGTIAWQQRWADDLQQGIRYLAQLAHDQDTLADRINQWLIDRAVAFGCHLSLAQMQQLLALDMDLNVQGLTHWFASNAPSS
ncbi:MAG: MBL fold metallo-hydrolase [Magnetococcales bacterium]|nr:MBL fold metallo-hydrolase [Magnetococcales bacterium]